jgi:hypothetical protein
MSFLLYCSSLDINHFLVNVFPYHFYSIAPLRISIIFLVNVFPCSVFPCSIVISIIITTSASGAIAYMLL